MAHECEIRSFEGAYKIEMKGAISLYMSTARDVLEGMYYKATGNYPIRTALGSEPFYTRIHGELR